jgi:type IV fimbrial biogenesis protein FimT
MISQILHPAFRGFTIIELMITLALAGVVLAIAIPSYNNTVKNNCLTTDTNSLITSIQLTRSEAIKRRQDVSIIAKGGNWATGWTVQDLAATVIQDVSLSCDATTVIEQGGDTTLVYNDNGFIDAPAAFQICDDRSAEMGRKISINMVGRPTTDRNFVCP